MVWTILTSIFGGMGSKLFRNVEVLIMITMLGFFMNQRIDQAESHIEHMDKEWSKTQLVVKHKMLHDKENKQKMEMELNEIRKSNIPYFNDSVPTDIRRMFTI